MLGNGIIGILSESCDLWERRAPLNPSHCARLLHSKYTGVRRIIVQPCTKRIHHDSQYEDVGCEISSDLSDCGLIIGVKQPKMEMILPDRAYAFFSHTHKAQLENMPLLDKILAERASLFDYELIVGDNGKRLLAFGKYAGRAGMVDFLGGLGKRYLNLGYSTPFLSLGASYMYPSLSSAKAAVIAVGEDIATFGLPQGISPIIFVFTGTGNVSQGAQEIFKLLPHKFVDVSDLPRLSKTEGNAAHSSSKSKRSCLVYGCVVTAEDIVSNNDPNKSFNKADYYAHPDHYSPVFHEKIAPYASVIVNCMYWEKRFPRLLSVEQFQEVTQKESPLVGICDITCDIGGSIEIVNHATSIEMPFFRYDPLSKSYHQDMKGNGVICLAVDILPTEFAREATQYFGDVLSEFIVSLASAKSVSELPPHLKRACICHGGVLTSLYEYIPRMRSHDVKNVQQSLQDNVCCRKEYSTLVSLSGHLFDKFLINEALDVIEAAGGSFQLVKCDVGQSVYAMSYSELEVAAADDETLNQIIDSLSAIANPSPELGDPKQRFVLKVGKVDDNIVAAAKAPFSHRILILGAGRVCEPAVSFLTSSKAYTSYPDICPENNVGPKDVQVIVASLYLSDAQKAVEGVPNALAVAIDVTDDQALRRLISEADVVISLVPPSFHVRIATLCIELQKHLVTASYVDSSMSNLNEQAKDAGITILCEMGLDPGIDHMMAMKMIDHAHAAGGKIKSFLSYCGGLPSPAAANNPLAYKLSWNPAGAIRSGLNPATFRQLGRKIHVDGAELYDSASYFRITDFPAFALECLPNRDSLVYGDSYGIESEASSIFRGTLRYEGFSAIMACLSKLGFFKSEAHPLLSSDTRPTYNSLLHELLKGKNGNCSEVYAHPYAASLFKTQIAEKLLAINCAKENTVAEKAATTIKFLGLDEESEIPKTCKSPFDVICMRMEEKLKYGDSEQDMVLLHHELEVEYPDGRKQERHTGTLLEFGLIHNGRMSSAMARTVSIPAAIGAQLLLSDRIKSRGVIRPLDAEVYVPALGILEEYGFKIMEKVELI